MESKSKIIDTKVVTKTKNNLLQLEVEVFYDEGSTTANGERKRGYYLLVVPALEDRKTKEKDYKVNCGVVKRISVSQRFSAKTLKNLTPEKQDVTMLVNKVKDKLLVEQL